MKKSVHISPSEWEVMAVVWEKAPVAAATIFKMVQKHKAWTLTTVRTLLRRLVSKGALAQTLDGKRYLYSPLVSNEDCARHESDSFISRVLAKAPSATLLHLVRTTDLSPQDIEELRQILHEKEKRS